MQHVNHPTNAAVDSSIPCLKGIEAPSQAGLVLRPIHERTGHGVDVELGEKDKGANVDDVQYGARASERGRKKTSYVIFIFQSDLSIIWTLGQG